MRHRLLASTSLPRASVLGTACLLLLSACESGTATRDPLDGLPAAGQIKLQLTHVDTCAELLTRVQDGFLVPLAERAKQLRTASSNDYYYGRDDGVAVGGSTPPSATPGDAVSGPATNNSSDPSGVPTSGSGTSAPRPSPQGEADQNGNQTDSDPALAPETPGSTPQPPGGGFSGTTVQVKDIDEADIVKTEGDRIYVLHGGTLFVLAGWPAETTAILGSTLVEGEPTEMFVRDGKAAVFSRVYGALVDQNARPSNDTVRYSDSQYTKVTLLDVSQTAPQVLRESYIEGDYVSARRHDGRVRVVVQDGFKVPQLGNPYIEYVDGFGRRYAQQEIDAQVDAWLERTERSIRKTEIGDWLPREFSKNNGQLESEEPRCADYYAPDAGLAESGVTSIVSFDLDAVSAPLGGATILGRAERVYANEDVVLLTQTDYRYQYAAGSTEQTIIHRFDIDGADTSYVASGAVPGNIHDQFSLDERAGVIRVSTTEERFSTGQGGIGVGMTSPGSNPTPPLAVDDSAPAPAAPPGTSAAAPAGMPQPDPKTEPEQPASTAAVAPDQPRPTPMVPPLNGPVNRVLLLGTDGDELTVLGSTENFGVSERIYSTRFIGDRGYVVTFRRTDPLFVVDLSDPAHPAVVGELEIPGFSDYLFPLDDDHLFAIGQDADANGVVRGIALQIFDVSDATRPALTQRYVLPELGASPANIDHRAISFHPNGNVIAFPYQSYQTGEASLQVFRVSPEDGFAPLGGMTENLDLDQCLRNYGYPPETLALIASDPSWQTEVLNSCRWGHQFKRGLFREDFVYGISDSGVYAYELAAMAAGAVGQVSLPAPVYEYGNYGGDPVPTPGNVKPLPGAPPTMGGASMPDSAGAGTGGASGSPTTSASPPAQPASDPDQE